MPYAITPSAIGAPVAWRAIRAGWPLVDGETFTVDEHPEGLVLADNRLSLRAPTNQEALAPQKQARQVYINRRRDMAVAAGVAYGGNRYDTDSQSINNLTAAVAFIEAALRLNMPVPPTVSWRTADNVDVALTPGQLVEFGAVIFTQVQTAHMTARALKDQIEALTTAREIEAVDWPA